MTCKDLCDKYRVIHKKIYDWFNIKFDIWGKTSTSDQTRITGEIFEGLYKNGYIEKRMTEMMYCPNCKIFLADRYIKGICYHASCIEFKNISNGDQCDICQQIIDVNKLINPFCSLCYNSPIKKNSEHLFLKLDLLQEQIKSYLNNKKNKFDSHVISIANSWLNEGIKPRCISRDLLWGTPIPIIDETLVNYDHKVFYVWFDACFGYYSILAREKKNWKEWVNTDDFEWIATQAKDNVPFHTIIFPASILGSQIKLPLPNKICATDYLLYENRKFSKSNGIGIFGTQVIEISKQLDITEDYWRFYLTKIRPEHHDSSFSWNKFIITIQSNLVNNIGNFINRCTSLVKKYYPDRLSGNFDIAKIKYFINLYYDAMDNFKFKDALNLCLKFSSDGNKYIQRKEPWIIGKKYTDGSIEQLDELKEILFQANLMCYILAKLLQPFIPKISDKILSVISIKSTLYSNVNSLEQLLDCNEISIHIIENIDPLFKKIKIEQINDILNELKI